MLGQDHQVIGGYQGRCVLHIVAAALGYGLVGVGNTLSFPTPLAASYRYSQYYRDLLVGHSF
ncbi:MAG: hypothetical protein ACXADX_15760 [Candidatus Hodarchaeales archaeon]